MRPLGPEPDAPPKVPAVPLTVEGSSVLHQLFRIRWSAWRAVPEGRRHEVIAEAAAALESMEASGPNATALYSVLGHKGDLLLLHFRPDFAALEAAERRIARLALTEYLEPTTSYLSMVELGLYDSSLKLYSALAGRGLKPDSDEWAAEVDAALANHRKAMAPRLFPPIPDSRYLCFYPMDRKRGESVNWYTVPMAERRRMMHDHGEVGRKYAGVVKQIISGSIGFDDWEWGVDLFAEDPLAFKKVIYEMRFDEASALYAAFGPFYVGLRVPARELGTLLG